MTRRERLEAKLEKRAEWAEKAQVRATQRFDTAHQISDGIPMGQPVLVGHHSERHHRRDLDRIDTNMRKGIEETRLANHHDAKADGLARQLKHSIFSDDIDAIAALEARIAERTRQLERMKALNAAYRSFTKLDGKSGLPDLTHDVLAKMQERLNAPDVYSWCRVPHPSYEISNLGATIRTDRERLLEIHARQAKAERAEAAGGVVVEDLSLRYCRVTFAEKPERSVIDALKAAGFRWGNGSWTGKRESLPEEVEREG